MRQGTLDKLGKVVEIIYSLRGHWPLTLRQIYYQCVSSMFIENNLREYKNLSVLLTKGRYSGQVPWDSMEDRTRSMIHSLGWEDWNEFATDQIDGFLYGYHRDKMQNQACAIELWIEKDALASIVAQVAKRWDVPVIVAKGFASVTYKNECRARIETNYQNDKITKILYLGDLDPSGWEMLPSMERTFEDKMDLEYGLEFETHRIGLLPEHVERYNLPHSIDAIKPKDSRTPKYVAKFGNLAVELDALRPKVLQELAENAIKEHVDLDLWASEVEAEKEDHRQIRKVQDTVSELIEGVL